MAGRRKLFDQQRGFCHYCSRQMTMRPDEDLTCTVDHIILQCDGGTRHRHNVVGACWQCNTARGSMRYHDFKANWRRVHAAGLPSQRSKNKPLNRNNPHHHLTVIRGETVTRLPPSVVYQYAKKP